MVRLHPWAPSCAVVMMAISQSARLATRVRFSPTAPLFFRDVDARLAEWLGTELQTLRGLFKSAAVLHRGGEVAMGRHQLCKLTLVGSIPTASTIFVDNA